MLRIKTSLNISNYICILGLAGVFAVGIATDVQAFEPQSKANSATEADLVSEAKAIIQENVGTEEAESVTANKVAGDAAGLYKPWYTPTTSDGYIPVQYQGVDADYLRTRPAQKTAVMLSYEGNVANVVRTGEGGVAQLLGGREGLHSVVASGIDGIAASGYYISNAPGAYPVSPPPVSSMGLVPLQDTATVYDLLGRPQTSASALGQIIPEEELTTSGMRAPVLNVSADGYIRSRVIIAEAEVARGYAGANVTFIRGGEVLAAATTDEMGIYEIPAVTVGNGFVSIVISGPQGYSVYASEVKNAVADAAEPEAPAEPTDTFEAPAAPVEGKAAIDQYSALQYVYFDDPSSTTAFIIPASNDTLPQLLDAINEIQQFLAQQEQGSGGGGGNQYGSGGGGAGGGDGLGALGALLGAAGLAAALLDDDDVVISPPGP